MRLARFNHALGSSREQLFMPPLPLLPEVGVGLHAEDISVLALSLVQKSLFESLSRRDAPYHSRNGFGDSRRSACLATLQPTSNSANKPYSSTSYHTSSITSCSDICYSAQILLCGAIDVTAMLPAHWCPWPISLASRFGNGNPRHPSVDQASYTDLFHANIRFDWWNVATLSTGSARV